MLFTTLRKPYSQFEIVCIAVHGIVSKSVLQANSRFRVPLPQFTTYITISHFLHHCAPKTVRIGFPAKSWILCQLAPFGHQIHSLVHSPPLSRDHCQNQLRKSICRICVLHHILHISTSLCT